MTLGLLLDQEFEPNGQEDLCRQRSAGQLLGLRLGS